MIICRKCQRHHPDSVGAGPCPCGADLRRDGIALVQSAEATPFDDSDLDELPPLEGTEPSGPPPGEPPLPTAPPPTPDIGPVAVEPPVADKSPVAEKPPATTTPPAEEKPSTPDDSDESASALKGRRRRARSLKPKTPAGGGGGAPTPTPAPPTSTPPTPSVTVPTSTDRPSPSKSTPSAPDVPQVVQADAVTTEGTGEAPDTGRRARSVNPRDLVAAKEDADAPNVGDAPASTTSTAPDAKTTTEMEPTPPQPRAGERACPSCFEPNPVARRFCKACGTTLPAPEEEPEEEEEPAAVADDRPRQGLRKRLKGAGGSRGGRIASSQGKRHAQRQMPRGLRQGAQQAGSWRQRARMVGGGGRMKYTSGLSGKSKLKAGAAVLVLIVGLVALLGPGRGKVLALVGRDGPEGVLPVEAELVAASQPSGGDGEEDSENEGDDENGEEEDESETGEEGEEGEDSGEIAGFPASALHDDDKLTAAAIPWDVSDPQPAGFLIRLEEPMVVKSILIAPGLPDDAEDGPHMLRPSRIRVCADTCDEVELRNSTSLQNLKVGLGEEVDSLVLTVLDVHEVEHTYPVAVISEVRVDH